MKVYFDNADISGLTHTGPHTFAHRLAKQLSLMGIELADSNDYDIALVTIEPSSKLNFKKPFVVRLDGIWFKPEEFQKRNSSIRNGYNLANGVIFQSEFDKNMITKWFGNHKKYSIIHNGIELKRVDTFNDAILRIRDTYRKIFVCSANWHPQKRLEENIRFYRTLREYVDSSCLIIMGSNPVFDKRSVQDNIFYTGSQSYETCLQVFAASDYMLHLAWLDHCPNTVVESLSQETPIICTNSGGTYELLGSNNKNGIVIKDIEYNYELMNYDNPPKIPTESITDELIQKILNPIEIDNKHLSIELCAKKYIEIFNIILNND